MQCATGLLHEAEHEQAKYQKACDAVPETALWDDSITARNILDIERHLMNGEILIRTHGKEDESISEMKQPVKAEDALQYEEPPSWIQPTRHVLGAALLKLGRYADAEAVYRQDIQMLRPNGWSLHGLGKALEGQRKVLKARLAMGKFHEGCKYADIQIDS